MPDLTLSPLARAARRWPHSAGLLWHGELFDYAALERDASRAAQALLARGASPGDRIAIEAPSCPEWLALLHAAPRVGVIVVPLNTRLHPHELAQQLERVSPRWLLHADETGRSAAERLPSATEPAGLRAFLQSGPEAEWRAPETIATDQTALLLFTSGTTGRPKIVPLTAGNLLASALASKVALRLRPRDRWLACMPLFHVGGIGILWRCALAGASVLLHDRFDPDLAEAAFQRYGATIASFVPTMLERWLAHRAGRPLPPSLRAIQVGGGPARRTILDACPAALATYGATETSSQMTFVRPGEAIEGSGRPLPFARLRIVDDEGSPLAVGETGWIEVRGPMVMRGYLDDPEAASVDPLTHGWLRIGDLGSLDDRGSLHVRGRREDLIVSGGENVYPAEVEAALAEDPAVLDAVVVGVEDPSWGEAPAALLVLSPDAGGFGVDGAAVVLERLGARLARYKIPRRTRVVESIPRLANGKPDRVTARAWLSEARQQKKK